MTPPQLHDRDGWPFKMLGPVPNRPADEQDWRAGILRGLIASADTEEATSS